MRLIRENRLLSAILAWALVAASWELTHVDPERGEPDPGERIEVLGERYPDTPRVLFTLGAKELRENHLEQALELLRRSYDGGYKEDENLYAAYIDVLVRTQSSRETIAEVIARWQRDYPASDRLARMRERLRNAKVLP